MCKNLKVRMYLNEYINSVCLNKKVILYEIVTEV